MTSKLGELRLSTNAYFYKLKDGASFSNNDIDKILKTVTESKQKSYLINERRVKFENVLVSCRVFKNKPETPVFLTSTNDSWKEIKIGYFVFIEYLDYVVIIKKYSLVPQFIQARVKQLGYENLLAIYAQDDTKFKKLSINNIYGSEYSMRNVSYESEDLQCNIPIISASHYCVRYVKGDNDGKPFSLTLNSSRINEYDSEQSISDICEWIKSSIQLLNDKNKSDHYTFLSVFATPENYSNNKLCPSSLLLFYNLVLFINDECTEADFFHKEKKVESPVIRSYIRKKFSLYINLRKEDKAESKIRYFVGKNGGIEIKVHKNEITLYNKTWQNIIIKGTPSGEYDGTLLDLINKWQQFSVSFEDSELIYTNRTLFRGTRLLKNIDYFLSYLYPYDSLKRTTCEKHSDAKPKDSKDWDADSIFKFLENTFKSQYDGFICDDYGHEWADYIGISNTKVSFFVAKHRLSKNSASDFQDVTGQALKNLGYLFPTKKQLEAKKKLWSEKYAESQISRFNSQSISLDDAIAMWLSGMEKPNYVREMCLVVDFVSKDDFKKDLALCGDSDAVCKSTIYQRLWLLTAFIDTCKEAGVEPKICCKP